MPPKFKTAGSRIQICHINVSHPMAVLLNLQPAFQQHRQIHATTTTTSPENMSPVWHHLHCHKWIQKILQHPKPDVAITSVYIWHEIDWWGPARPWLWWNYRRKNLAWQWQNSCCRYSQVVVVVEVVDICWWVVFGLRMHDMLSLVNVTYHMALFLLCATQPKISLKVEGMTDCVDVHAGVFTCSTESVLRKIVPMGHSQPL